METIKLPHLTSNVPPPSEDELHYSARDLEGERFGYLEPVYHTDERLHGSIIWVCLCHSCGRVVSVPTRYLTQEGVTSCKCRGVHSIIGKRSGDLVALSVTEARYLDGVSSRVSALCDCGNVIYITISDFKKRQTCGCSNRLKFNSGERFGRLTVLEFSHCENGNSYFKCRCQCGEVVSVMGSLLKKRKTRSCGCLHLDWFNNNLGLSGKDNPAWKGGVTPKRVKERNNEKLKPWKLEVLSRSGFKCEFCLRNISELHVHHLNSFADFPNQRTKVDNGITLCEDAHWHYHGIYGMSHARKEDFIEWYLKIVLFTIYYIRFKYKLPPIYG